jgi:uncharacterized protein with NAD-binding domain and iron-sulfur cluster
VPVRHDKPCERGKREQRISERIRSLAQTANQHGAKSRTRDQEMAERQKQRRENKFDHRGFSDWLRRPAIIRSRPRCHGAA